MRARIVATGSFLPQDILSNQDLEKLVDTSDEWIVTRTGIRERHIAAEGQKTSDLAVAAARQALANGGIDAQDIDLIIVATSTPDLVFPSTACIVQQKLGIDNHCAAFDVQAVCSGFIYALSIADKFIRCGEHQCVLVIGAEIFSRITDYSDRGNCILWGDGAGAVIVRPDAEHGIISTHLHADGNYSHLLCTTRGPSTRCPDDEKPVSIHMEGNAVFKVAVRTLDAIVEETLSANAMDKSAIDWLVPHQANIRIIEATARKLGMDRERVVITVAEHGNTSAASVPLALHSAVADGRIQRGQIVLMEAFGGGFTWGSVLLSW